MRTAAHRGISLSLVMGFLAPLCIVITPETPALPNASAVAGDNIDITGAMPAAPSGATLTAADITDAVMTAAAAVWVGVTAPSYTVAVGDLEPPAIATTAGSSITIDADAAGRLWHTGTASGPADANAGVDLVTVLAHEIGHVLGFGDLDPASFANEVMTNSIEPGVRRATIGAHTWTVPVSGTASAALATGTLTVGAASMPQGFVSDIVVVGGTGVDTLTVTSLLGRPLTVFGGDSDDDGDGQSDGPDSVAFTGTDDIEIVLGETTPSSTVDRIVVSTVESVTGGTGSDTVLAPPSSSVRFTGDGAATIRDSFNSLVANVSAVENFVGSAGATTYSTGADATIGALTLDADDRFVVETESRTPTTGDPATAATDTLTVSNTATLGGTLEVRPATGAVAGVTTASAYLSAGTVAQSFATFVGLDLGGGGYVALTHTDGPPAVRSMQATALPRGITIDFVDDATANALLAFIAGETTTPPSAPTAIELTVNGQGITGTATFTKPSGALVQIALSGVVVRLGDADNPLVTVEGTGSATLRITPDTDTDTDGNGSDTDEDNSNLALVGTFSGTITTTIDALSISGSVSVSVDAQRSSAIKATATGIDFKVAGEPIDVGATDSITFERVVAGGDSEIRITGLADQTISLGDDGTVVEASLLSVAGDDPTYSPVLTLSGDGIRLVSVNSAGAERPTEATLSLTAAGVTVDSSLAIDDVARTSDVVTVGTTTAHGLAAGQTVVVDSTDDDFDGAFVVKAVVDTTHFTYALAGTDTSSPISGGTIQLPLAITLDTTTVPGRFRLSASRVTLTVGGRTFTTGLNFEALPDGTGGRPVVVSVTGLATRVMSGATTLLDVTNGSGTFILTADGIAGTASVGLAVDIDGFALQSSATSLELNSTGDAVQRTVTSGLSSATVSLPAGPFFRVRANDVQATVALPTLGSVQLAGDLLFEHSSGVTSLGVSDLSITTSITKLFDAEDAFIVRPTGVAGVISGKAAVAVDGVAVGGRVGLRINSTGAAVSSTTITVGDRSNTIAFTETEALDLFGTLTSLSLGSFATIEGSVEFTGDSATIGEGTVIFVGEGPVALGSGDNPSARGIKFVAGTGGSVLKRIGTGSSATYAIIISGTITLLGIRGVSGTSATAVLRFNTTGQAQDFASGDDFLDGDEVLELTSGAIADLEIGGQAFTVGSTTIGRHTTADGRDGLAVSLSGLAFDLAVDNGGPQTLVAVTGGTGVLLLLGEGAAASVSGQAAIAGGDPIDASVALNTTGLAIDEQIRGLALQLAAGNYLRVAVQVASDDPIDIGPISLSGGFMFQAGDDSILIVISDGSFAFGDLITITGVNGSFEWDGTDFAGSLSGLVESALPAVQIGGTLNIEFDSSGVTGLPSALTITVDGYQFDGTVAIGRSATETTFSLTNGHLVVGPVAITVPSAVLTVEDGGDATATITNAQVAVNVGGFQLNGTVSIDVDTGEAAGSQVAVSVTPSLVKVGDVTLHSGASPPTVTIQRTTG